MENKQAKNAMTLAEKIALVAECYARGSIGGAEVSLQVTIGGDGAMPCWTFVARAPNGRDYEFEGLPEYRLSRGLWAPRTSNEKTTDPTPLVDQVLQAVYRAMQQKMIAWSRAPGARKLDREWTEVMLRQIEQSVVG